VKRLQRIYKATVNRVANKKGQLITYWPLSYFVLRFKLSYYPRDWGTKLFYTSSLDDEDFRNSHRQFVRQIAKRDDDEYEPRK
jgi:hypothetical protein